MGLASWGRADPPDDGRSPSVGFYISAHFCSSRQIADSDGGYGHPNRRDALLMLATLWPFGRLLEQFIGSRVVSPFLITRGPREITIVLGLSARVVTNPRVSSR